jgi:hypothetical protein
LRSVFSAPRPAAGPSFFSLAALRLSRPEPMIQVAVVVVAVLVLL